MTMFARSDLNEINVSGGCGETHKRPFVKGLGKGKDVREKTWALTCIMCERVLADDDAWAKNEATIPLTPDEQLESEVNERAGNAMVKQVAQAMASAASDAVREMGPMVRG